MAAYGVFTFFMIHLHLNFKIRIPIGIFNSLVISMTPHFWVAEHPENILKVFTMV